MAAAWFRKLFRSPSPILGVVHLAPLPGSIGHRLPLAKIIAQAERDAENYVRGGIDGLIVENFGDAPFRRGPVAPHTVAAMTRCAMAIKGKANGKPVGVNVLRNDGFSALGVAAAADLAFIRVNVLTGVAVTDQGFIEGDAAELLAYRKLLGVDIPILADFRVKHATQLRVGDLAVEVSELVDRARADAILITGPSTGSPPDLEELAAIRRVAPKTPILVASGASKENLAELSRYADGLIVGTAMKRGGVTEGPVDVARVRAMTRLLDPTKKANRR